MKYLHLDYRPDNPYRPVDWRWQLAAYVGEINNWTVPKSHRDHALCRATFFRQHITTRVSPAAKLYMLETDPACYEAWHIYSYDHDKSARWEVEARLLAKESLSDIAQKVAVSEEAIKIYESWFFNVLDRLESPGYITHQVFGRSIHQGLSSRNFDCLWKMYAYWLGPIALDAIIYQFNRPMPPGNTSGVNAALDNDAALTMRLKATVALRTIPVNWETQIEIIKLYMNLLEIEKSASDVGSGSGASGQMLACMEEFVQRIPWRRHQETKALPEDPIGKLRVQGVCLRSQELLLAATDGIPTDTVKLLSSARFPTGDVIDVARLN